VYRNIRYTLDRGHPLQVPCGGKARTFGLFLNLLSLLKPSLVVEAVGMW
jgi:hypothetical protein